MSVKTDADLIIDRIRWARFRNNDAWMAILRIAMRAAPDETKAVLRAITTNDRVIADDMTKLAE